MKPINLKYDKNRFEPGETHVLYDNIKNGEQNLYLVSTPGQMLSAIEAQNHFQTKNNVLVILFFVVKDGKNINQMFKLSELFPFDKLITYQNNTKRNYISFIHYLNILTQNPYGYVYIGYNSPLYRRMIANIEYKKLYYLDTGMHTITTQEQIYNINNLSQNNPYREFKERKRKEKVLSLVYQSKGYNIDTRMEDLNFFTVFNIDSYKNEKIITHNYEYIKSLFSKDLNEYMSILLKIYKSNMNGHIDILNKKRMMDIPLNKKSLVSSSGISLDIYPDTIKTVKGYQNRLQSSIVSQEKKFLENKLVNDKELLKRLQNALVFKDGIIFNSVLNNMIEIFKNRMFEILNIQSKNQTKRVIELIFTLNESLKLISEDIVRFKQQIKIDNFYLLFETILIYVGEIRSYKEKILLLNSSSQLYVSYAKSINRESEKKVFDEYFYKNHKEFKNKLIKILILLPRNYYVDNYKVKILAKKISNGFLKNDIYKKSSYSFYQTLFLINKLEENTDKLCQYFIFKNFKITNIENHLEALEILLNNFFYFKDIEYRIWDIYSKATYSREYRVMAGFILVKFYYNYGKKAKAIKLYFQIWKQFGCKNRDDALKYLDTMKVLNLYISYREVFEKLYNQYIFEASLDTDNSDVLLDFLRYEEYMYKIEKRHDVEKEYTNRPINLKYDKNRFKPGETHVLYEDIKSGEQNLYLVSTPGQMLSAIEAQNHFKTKNNVLVILFFIVRDGKEINEMFKLSEFFPFDKLITYQNREKKNYVAFINYLNILTQYQYNHVFIGYNSPLYRRMIVNLEYKNLYYLDTGMHAITTQEQIYNKNNISKKNPYTGFQERKRNEKILALIYQSRGYQMDTRMEDLNFFTVFNIESYRNEKIITHNYDYVKSLFSKDLNTYMSILLKIHKFNMNGHIEILNKKRMTDIPLTKKSLVSSSGISLDIYPDTITTVKGYQSRLQSYIISQERNFLENKLMNDTDLLKRLQNSLLFKDEIIFRKVLNSMIEIFQNRMFKILNIQNQNTIKRVLGLISTLNESFKLLTEKGTRFKEEIEIDGFYFLFDTIILYLSETKNYKEKILLLNAISTLYVNYGKSINNQSHKKVFEEYLYTNHKVFKHVLVKVLLLLPAEYYENNFKVKSLAKEIAYIYLKTERYKANNNRFYQTLLLEAKLEASIDTLYQYFISKEFKIIDLDQHLEILKILLNKPFYFKKIKEKIWYIYSRARYAIEYRIKAGLILVESYYYYGQIAKAIKLYFQIWKKYNCKNRNDALEYLDAMRLLKLDESHREIFEKLYNQHVFGASLNSYNSDVLLEFLKYQKHMYNREEHDNINKEYTNQPVNIRYDKKRFKPGETHILYDNIQPSQKQNLYLVSTPGQMLSAIEAQNHFKTKNNVLVILFFVVRDGKNINQMFNLSKFFPFDKLITYQNKSAKFYISFIPFLKLLKKIEVNYLFFGFNTILYRRMVANITYKKLYYLDDGVHTITTHEDTYNKGNTNTRKEYLPFPKTINLQKMKFIYGRYGLKVDKYLDDLNFFTVYNLKEYGNEKIIKHNFSYISSLLIKNNEINNTVYILGQPLVEIVGVEQEVYIQYLKNIFEYYADYKILFTPHRLEVVHEEIQHYISERNNIKLFIPDEPIEFYFLNNSIYPLEVASFITSALFNIRKLFPKTKTRAFEIDLTKLDKHHRSGILLIYKHFRNEDIELIREKK